MIITDKAQIKVAELKESNNLRLSRSDELECYELIESDLKLPADVTFARSSIAYLSDGTQVPANLPRFEPGKFGKAVMVEEGTTNLVTNPGFENGTKDGWSYMSDGPAPDYNYAVTTEDSWEGNYCVKLWTSPNATKDVAIATAMVPVDTTKTYACSVCVKGDIRELAVQCFDFNNVYIGAILFPLYDSGYHPNWVRDTVIVGPSNFIPGTAKIRIKRSVYGPSKVGYIDAAQIEQKPYPTSFIDGTRSAETLTIPTAGILNSQEGTIEFWIYPLELHDWNDYLGGTGGYPDGRWLLFAGASGLLAWSWSPGPEILTSSGVIVARTWYYVVLRWGQGVKSIWVNGVKKAEGSHDGSYGFPNPFGFGVVLTYDVNSLIDDLRISSRARTDAEILAVYQSRQPLLVDEWTTYKLDFDDKVRITTQGQLICSELIEI